MPKIAIFLTALDGGGAERVMLNLAKGFVMKGIKVDLLLVKAEGEYIFQIPPRVRLIDFQQNRLLTSVFSLIHYLQTEQPQALLTAMDTNVIAGWLRRWSNISTTTIVTVHNHLSLESYYGDSVKRKLTAKFARWFYGWADNIVAVSEGVALDLQKIGLEKEKIKVIYNPIVDDELTNKIQKPCNHPWFETGQPPVVLAVGRLTKQKDFSTLLLAFAKVSRQTPARLMILGEGEERTSLESLVRELDLESDVVLLGFVDNPYKYMSKASVLVLSSVWEGFGNVLVEAMAAGTPVVSTNCKSGPAEILANGKHGKLVAVGDSNGMAEAIVQTFAEYTDVKSLQNRALEFSSEQAISQYQQLMNLDAFTFDSEKPIPKIAKLLITGNERFLYRYHFLVMALSQYVEKVETLASGNFSNSPFVQSCLELIDRVAYQISLSTADRIFHKNKRAFITKSKNTEAQIRLLESKPDLILHFFGMYCPIWDGPDIPYAMYLDYTMALAIKKWSPWAPFFNKKERQNWLDCEQKAYLKAKHIFSMSELVKNSLIKDYGIHPKKITVVGSAGHFETPYKGRKTFGTQQILFNGSDFGRKGGDIVLAAFQKVKQVLPNSKLVIIGKKINTCESGIINPGRISSVVEMRDLFLNTDLVVAPSHCEPFQEFLLEALNYGIPCIVSNQDGMPELISNGIDGVVIDDITPDNLAKQIIEILPDTTRLLSMSEQAREKIGNKFNWDAIAYKMLQHL